MKTELVTLTNGQSWYVLHVLENESTKEVRVLLRRDSDQFCVIKSFPNAEINSIKFWTGDLNKVMSYWRTQTPVSGPERLKQIIKAVNKLDELVKSLQKKEMTNGCCEK